MIVSVTEVQSFKRCRRQWDYGSLNRQGITPILQPKPYLDLGTMIHKTLAYWTEKPVNNDGSPINLRHVFLAIAYQHRQTAVEKYVKATGHTPTDEEMQPLDDAIVLGACMAENYQAHYGVPLPPHLTFCSPEQEILVPIPGTDHDCTECNGTGGIESGVQPYFPRLPAYTKCETCNGTGVVPHYLKARLDALAQDTQGSIYVVERKTYDKRPDLYLLEVSDQFIGYVWTAQQLNLGPVIGIAYDGLWKRATPPQRPKKLTLEDLFVRTIIPPAQDEVDEYGTELARTVVDMANNPYIYKNRQWQGCWDCSFEQLCRTQSQKGDVEFILAAQYTKRTEEDTADIVAGVDQQPVGMPY